MNSLLRSKGRLEKCLNLSYDQKNPIILHKNSFLTELIIWDSHLSCKHMGSSSTLVNVRQSGFWIPNARSVIKRILSQCVTCKKINSLAFRYPKPNDYVLDKVTFETPYKNTGIDYTGHVFVKIGETLRKMYLLVFTCMNIRAVHIELLPDLSCKEFLQAFTRFCNCYTIPHAIYSDNEHVFASIGYFE